MELLLLIPTAILGFLFWDQRADRTAERQEWATERERLLDRIQAPEKIVNTYEPSNVDKSYVPYDDDAAFWRAKEMSDGAG